MYQITNRKFSQVKIIMSDDLDLDMFGSDHQSQNWVRNSRASAISAYELQTPVDVLVLLSFVRFAVLHYCCHCQAPPQWINESRRCRMQLSHKCSDKVRKVALFGECPFNECSFNTCQIGLDIRECGPTDTRANNFKWDHFDDKSQTFGKENDLKFLQNLYKIKALKEAYDTGSLKLPQNPASSTTLITVNLINDQLIRENTRFRRLKLDKSVVLDESWLFKAKLVNHDVIRKLQIGHFAKCHTNDSSVYAPSHSSSDVNVETNQNHHNNENDNNANDNNENDNNMNDHNMIDNNANAKPNVKKSKKTGKKKQKKQKKINEKYWNDARKKEFTGKHDDFQRAKKLSNVNMFDQGIFNNMNANNFNKAAPFRLHIPNNHNVNSSASQLSSPVNIAAKCYKESICGIMTNVNVNENQLFAKALRNKLETDVQWMLHTFVGTMKPNSHQRNFCFKIFYMLDSRNYEHATSLMQEFVNQSNEHVLLVWLALLNVWCFYLRQGYTSCKQKLGEFQAKTDLLLHLGQHLPLFKCLFALSQNIDKDLRC